MVSMMDPHFSPLSLGQLRSLPVSGKERAKKGERRVIEMRGWRLKSSASQYQKFHPGFQPHIRKQIHLSHHRSLTPQLIVNGYWPLGPGRDGAGQTGEGTSGQHSSLAQRLSYLPWRPDCSVIPQKQGCLF